MFVKASSEDPSFLSQYPQPLAQKLSWASIFGCKYIQVDRPSLFVQIHE